MLRNISLIFSTLILFMTMVCAQDEEHILSDKGNMFSTEQESSIIRKAKELEQESDLKFKVATIETLAGKSTQDTIPAVAHRMQLNGQGLAVSALILLIKKERKLDVQFGAALEWEIPDDKVRFIKRDIIERFKSGDFVGGVQVGMERIKEYANYARWEVDYTDYSKLKESQHLAGNKIVSFPVEAVTRRFKKEKITEAQFNSKYFVYVHAPDDQLVKIRFAKNQLPFINELLKNKSVTIYGRVTNTNPLDLNLMGVDW